MDIPNAIVVAIAEAQPPGDAHCACHGFALGLGEISAPKIVGMFAMVGNVPALADFVRALDVAILNAPTPEIAEGWRTLVDNFREVMKQTTEIATDATTTELAAAQMRGDLPQQMTAPLPGERPLAPTPGLKAPAISS